MRLWGLSPFASDSILERFLRDSGDAGENDRSELLMQPSRRIGVTERQLLHPLSDRSGRNDVYGHPAFLLSCGAPAVDPPCGARAATSSSRP